MAPTEDPHGPGAPATEDFGDPTPGGAGGPWRTEPMAMAHTRSIIAYVLLGLLGGILAASWIGLLTGRAAPSDVRELLTETLSPVAALVGAATGFYYGERRR
jgi:hypothetical protein